MKLSSPLGTIWQIGDEPLVMGVLNATPDSFSDGGRHFRSSAVATANSSALNLDVALAAARDMVAEGAVIIDVGGESTRPGAQPVSEQQELDRVIPLVEKIAAELDCVISVDTSTAAVMREAAAAGAGLLNDVRSFQCEGALEVAVASRLPLCLMHMLGEPRTMQADPQYHNVVEEVAGFLNQRITALCAAGARREQLMIDPGFGFGKLLQHNLQLLVHLDRLNSLQCKILVGMSRKSMIGQVLDKPVAERLFGGVALASIAVMHGANVVRTHDVAATVDAVKMAYAVKRSS